MSGTSDGEIVGDNEDVVEGIIAVTVVGIPDRIFQGTWDGFIV
jgi:hypothetical protein